MLFDECEHKVDFLVAFIHNGHWKVQKRQCSPMMWHALCEHTYSLLCETGILA